MTDSKILEGWRRYCVAWAATDRSSIHRL